MRALQLTARLCFTLAGDLGIAKCPKRPSDGGLVASWLFRALVCCSLERKDCSWQLQRDATCPSRHLAAPGMSACALTGCPRAPEPWPDRLAVVNVSSTCSSCRAPYRAQQPACAAAPQAWQANTGMHPLPPIVTWQQRILQGALSPGIILAALGLTRSAIPAHAASHKEGTLLPGRACTWQPS